MPPEVPTSCDSSQGSTSVPKVVGGNSHTKAATETWPIENQHRSDSPHISDDEHSGHILERDYTGMFEGPEKTLEVVFRKVDHEHTDYTPGLLSGSNTVGGPIQRTGLRRLTRSDLDLICSRARCTILSCISNQYVDAYVLSESSLFVYPYMLVLKTCGTTTLLRCIATLIDLGRKLGLEIDWVGYSRKNFNYPGDQSFPHQSFHQELDYLYGHRNLCERLDGNGYTLGPVTADHWFVFVADHTIRSKSLEIDTDRVLNIMMFDIDESVSKLFYYDQYDKHDVLDGNESKEDEAKRISNEQTVASGINALCPGALMDPRAFEPCGYSMNALLFRSYTTIHITPESNSSYVSFETNQKVASYSALVRNVIRTFRPKRFVMTLMADENGLKQVKENPLVDSGAAAKIVVPAARPSTPTANHGAQQQRASFSATPTTTNEASATRPHRASFTATSTATSSQEATSSSTAHQHHHNNSKAHHIVYKRQSLASIKVEEDCCCMMGNWVVAAPEKMSPRSVAATKHKPRGMSLS